MPTLTMTAIADKVASEVNALANRPVADNDQAIFVSGVLDSLNVLHIIMFMESEFDITVDPFDVNLEILGTVNKIAAFIHSRLGRGNGQTSA